MVYFVEIPLSSLAVLTGGNVAGGSSLAAPPDAGLTWGAAGQRGGGPEQRAALADVALTCSPAAGSARSVRLRTARWGVPVAGGSEGSAVAPRHRAGWEASPRE